MKVCSKCGANNSDDAKFCAKCSVSMQPSGGKTCPSGRHTMDPTWSECVYCRSEGLLGAAPPPAAGLPSPPPVRRPTVVEGGALDPSLLPPRAPVRPPTHVEATPLPPRPLPQPYLKSTPAGGHQAPPKPRPGTILRQERPSGPLSPPPVASGRKIVGVLVSYSWYPEGKIFPIREGRNLIGHDSDCDISVPEDETMSGQNSSIQFRQNFILRDKDSMSGTDVNGMPVEDQCQLVNYSTIRAGSTYFTFLSLQPPAGPPSPGSAES
jgi:hypothetical protein